MVHIAALTCPVVRSLGDDYRCCVFPMIWAVLIVYYILCLLLVYRVIHDLFCIAMSYWLAIGRPNPGQIERPSAICNKAQQRRKGGLSRFVGIFSTGPGVSLGINCHSVIYGLPLFNHIKLCSNKARSIIYRPCYTSAARFCSCGRKQDRNWKKSLRCKDCQPATFRSELLVRQK